MIISIIFNRNYYLDQNRMGLNCCQNSIFYDYSSTIQCFNGLDDQEMKEEIFAYHLEFMNKISQKLKGRYTLFKNKCTIKVVLCDRLKTCAGLAYYEQKIIKINYHLHKRNPHELRNTYGHELAHILTYVLYGKVRNHGREWKAIMKALNLNPSATYDRRLIE